MRCCCRPGQYRRRLRAREQKQSPTSTGESSRKRIQMETRALFTRASFNAWSWAAESATRKGIPPVPRVRTFSGFSYTPRKQNWIQPMSKCAFRVAQRHNLLCVIASPDGRKKSLKVLQDALIYSSILDPGHHLVHELLPGRSAWLHVIHGETAMQEIILTEGDGAGVRIEPSVSITAQEDSEILLVDLGPEPRFLSGRAGP